MRLLTAMALSALFGLLSSITQAAGLPLVISATIDYTQGTLTIGGRDFGSNPVVTLNNLSFPTVSAASNQIVANFPSGQPAASFAPGTYFLLVTYRNQLPSVFEVAIGANGPQGPAGLQGVRGLQGLQGVQGLMGNPGAAGAMGPPGPAGATGSAGAQGPAGLQGVAGPQGPKGDTGSQGPAGSIGGLPTCSAPDVAVLYNGAFICKSAVPRFVDNGDGTVTDNTTGLMWEKKSPAGTGDVHDVSLLYTWNDSTIDGNFGPSGTLYSAFIQQLNGLNFPPVPCFAGYCDWRIPGIGELRAIVSPPYPTCTSAPCIDPIFGPTAASIYWSATSAAEPQYAWWASFYDGVDNVNGVLKSYSLNARAVRGGR